MLLNLSLSVETTTYISFEGIFPKYFHLFSINELTGHGMGRKGDVSSPLFLERRFLCNESFTQGFLIVRIDCS